MDLKFLESLMVYKNVSRSQLAEKVGISYATLNSKLGGTSDFTIKEAKKINNILNLSLDDFVKIFLQ